MATVTLCQKAGASSLLGVRAVVFGVNVEAYVCFAA